MSYPLFYGDYSILNYIDVLIYVLKLIAYSKA